ncbi:MAG: ABC transporter permease [Nitrospira sp.]|nr:ABC transporter permease [Nitrospira sp.]
MSSQAQAEATIAPSRRKLIIEKRSSRFDMNWSELWEYRELGYVLIWRDITVRYKQTAIGIAWVVLQPLIAMLIFTAVFGKMAKVPSDGIWYPVFSLTALLPWMYFSQAVSRAGKAWLQMVG